MRFKALSALGILLALVPGAVLAQATLPTNPCPFDFLPCSGGGVQGLVGYIETTFFPAMRILFIALALAQLFYSGYRMMAESGDENVQKETKGAYEQIIYGCSLVSLATFIVDAFGSGAQQTLIEPDPIAFGISNIIFYFKVALAGVVTAVIIIQGIRLILVVNEDLNEKSKAEKNLINAFFGVAAILLADTLVNAFFPGAGTVGLADEVRGFANFMMEIFAGMAVLSFIVAGMFLVFSVDEGLRDRAKKTCLTAAVATAIIISAYVLVNYFLSL